MLSLPNNPLIVTAVQALAAGGASAHVLDGGWRTSREGAPYFDFWSGSGGHIRARVASDEPQGAWSDIEAFSALTIDVAIALLAALAAPPFRSATSAPRRAPLRLGAPAILALKRYHRFGKEREHFAGMVEAEIARVLRLRFDIQAYPASTRAPDAGADLA